MGIYLVAAMWVGIGFAAGWFGCVLWRAFFVKPVEGIYWKDGMPHIAPGYFPPMPECKKPKKETNRGFIQPPEPWPRCGDEEEAEKIVKELS